MKISQMPLNASQAMTPARIRPPNATMPQPARRPSRAAKRVARLRSPVSFQAIARAIRPPSSGKPGIRLKISTSTFTAVR